MSHNNLMDSYSALPAKPNANEHVRIAKENIVLIIMKVALLQWYTTEPTYMAFKSQELTNAILV